MIFGKFFRDKSEQKVIKAPLVSSEGLNSEPKEITSSGWKSKKKQKEIQPKTEHTHREPQYWACYCGAELHPEDGKVLREHTTCDYFYSHKTYRKR